MDLKRDKDSQINGQPVITEELEADPEDKNAFWLATKAYKNKDKPDQEEFNCKIKLDVRILPKTVANQAKAGTGRNEPNCDPFLFPPVGRISLSMNPMKMID